LISPFPSYSESNQPVGLFLGELSSLKYLFIMKDLMAVYCPNDSYEKSMLLRWGEYLRVSI